MTSGLMVVANPLMNGLLLPLVGGTYMHTRCIHRSQHPNLKGD